MKYVAFYKGDFTMGNCAVELVKNADKVNANIKDIQ